MSLANPTTATFKAKMRLLESTTRMLKSTNLFDGKAKILLVQFRQHGKAVPAIEVVAGNKQLFNSGFFNS